MFSHHESIARWSGTGIGDLTHRIRCTDSSVFAATLAYMRQGRFDIGPDLLVFVIGQDLSVVPPLRAWGNSYLHAFCKSEASIKSAELLDAVTLDALGVLLYRRNVRTVADGAKALRTRTKTYGELRSLVLSAFKVRLIDAITRFELALSGNPFTRKQEYSKQLKNGTPIHGIAA